MNYLALSDREFTYFRNLLYEHTGIAMAAHKKALVAGRLAPRLRHHGLESYRAYFELATDRSGQSELQIVCDLLTTNETYFYREPKHFDFLREHIIAKRAPGGTFRIWSAASSSGEEVYTLAFVLADACGVRDSWEILGSDISSRVLARARAGRYPLERIKGIPPANLKEYCLKGVGAADGDFLIAKRLRDRVRFISVNLNAGLPDIGMFDVIFVRNVMIYFDTDTKREVVQRLASKLNTGGYLFVSHTETLNVLSEAFEVVHASIYRKR